MNKKYTAIAAGSLLTLGVLALPFATFAQNLPTGQAATHKVSTERKANGKNMRGVNGTVITISGTTITLTNKAGTVYTVDATNAK